MSLPIVLILILPVTTLSISLYLGRESSDFRSNVEFTFYMKACSGQRQGQRRNTNGDDATENREDGAAKTARVAKAETKPRCTSLMSRKKLRELR